MNRFFEQIAFSLREMGRGIQRFFGGIFRGIANFFGDAAYSAGSAPRAIGAFFVGLGRVLLWILLLPVNLVRWLIGGIVALAKLPTMAARLAEEQTEAISRTAQEAAVGLQEQPKSFFRRFGDFFGAIGTGFLRQPLWLRIVVSSFALLAVLGTASIPFAFPLVQQYRAAQALEEAAVHFEAGREVEAFLQARTASYMNQNDPEILLKLVEYATALRQPGALDYCRQLIELEGESTESLFRFVETAQALGRAAEAEPYLARLQTRLGDNERLAGLVIRNVVATGNVGVAYGIARREILERDHATPEIVTVYGSIGLQNDNEELRQETLATLATLVAEGADDVRIAAGLLLLRLPELSPEEAAEWIGQLRKIPGLTEANHLSLMEAEIRTGLTTFAERRDEILALEGDGLPAARLGQWLFANGQPQSTLEVVSDEEWLEDAALFRIRSSALIELERGQEVVDALTNPAGLPVSESERLFLRAVALRSLERLEAYRATVEQAIATAEPEEYLLLERFIRSLGDPRFLLPLYETISRDPQTARLGQAGLLLASYQLGEEKVLTETLRRVRIERFKTNASVQSLIGYLDALRNERVENNLPDLERIVAENPSLLDFRVSLAHSYYRVGRQADALSLLRGMEESELRLIPGYFATAVALERHLQDNAESEENPAATFDSAELITLEEDFIREISGSGAEETAQVNP